MTDGDVETMSKRGQWVNRVIGDPERSRSFRTKDEAIDAGRELAARLGTEHRVIESDESGVITDEDETAEGDWAGDGAADDDRARAGEAGA